MKRVAQTVLICILVFRSATPERITSGSTTNNLRHSKVEKNEFDENNYERKLTIQSQTEEDVYIELPKGSIRICPTASRVTADDCACAGLSVGGKLNSGKVLINDSADAPSGCFLDRNGIVNFRENQNGVDGNKDYSVVCKKKHLKLPKGSVSGCPSEAAVNVDDCSAAGLMVGGKLEEGSVVMDNWDSTPSGCFLDASGIVKYNTNKNGENGTSDYSAVCKDLYVELKKGQVSRCPLGSQVSEEDCAAAGLSVGGTLENGKMVVYNWSHTPAGCFLNANGDVKYSTNEIGYGGSKSYSAVCKKQNSIPSLRIASPQLSCVRPKFEAAFEYFIPEINKRMKLKMVDPIDTHSRKTTSYTKCYQKRDFGKCLSDVVIEASAWVGNTHGTATFDLLKVNHMDFSHADLFEQSGNITMTLDSRLDGARVVGGVFSSANNVDNDSMKTMGGPISATIKTDVEVTAVMEVKPCLVTGSRKNGIALDLTYASVNFQDTNLYDIDIDMKVDSPLLGVNDEVERDIKSLFVRMVNGLGVDAIRAIENIAENAVADAIKEVVDNGATGRCHMLPGV